MSEPGDKAPGESCLDREQHYLMVKLIKPSSLAPPWRTSSFHLQLNSEVAAFQFKVITVSLSADCLYSTSAETMERCCELIIDAPSRSRGKA